MLISMTGNNKVKIESQHVTSSSDIP